MESIDRLREYVEKAPRTSISLMARATLLGMARAIEQEVEHGWVRLPLDADGEPIHVGDVMEWYQGGNVFTVTALHLVSREWEVWGDDAEYAPDECRHHHEPTVEDVLREFANRVCNSGHQWGLDAADTIAEYAAKLRLASNEE